MQQASLSLLSDSDDPSFLEFTTLASCIILVGQSMKGLECHSLHEVTGDPSRLNRNLPQRMIWILRGDGLSKAD